MKDISKSLSETYQQVHHSQVISNTIESLEFKKLKAHNMRSKISRMIKEGHTVEDGLDLKKTVRKITEAIAKVDDKIDELRELRRDVLSYVTVMPHVQKVEDPQVLSPDEIYALNTRGYVKDPAPQSEVSNSSPPPARPDMDRRDLNLYRAGDPLNGVVSDRLQSSQRFEDMIRQSAMDSQTKLNDTLDSARNKLPADVARKLKANADEVQKINQKRNRDTNVAHYEAYFNRIGR